MSKLKMATVTRMIQDLHAQMQREGLTPSWSPELNSDTDILVSALQALLETCRKKPVSDPSAAWDALRAQLWGARSGCQEAWAKMAHDIKGCDRDLMSRSVQVAQVDEKLRLNFSREFYLNHRQACHSTIAYWVAAARHLGHTSRPGKRDDGSGYVEFSLEPSTD